MRAASPSGRTRENRRWGRAWVLLTGVVAVHVADEAANDFLSFYNPLVEARSGGFPWSLLPTFDFATWLGLLVLAVAVLTALSPLVFRGKWGMKPVAWVYGCLMTINAAGHIAVALWVGSPVAGVWSSPLLLGASFHLLRSVPGKTRSGCERIEVVNPTLRKKVRHE